MCIRDRPTILLATAGQQPSDDNAAVQRIAPVDGRRRDLHVPVCRRRRAGSGDAEALATIQALGDVRAIAVTQANFGLFLVEQGEAQTALEMLWSAYTSLVDAGYAADAATLRDRLTGIKRDTLRPDRFDALWATAIGGAQPDWLAAPQPASP